LELGLWNPSTAYHDAASFFQVLKIDERIPVQEDEIGSRTHLDRAEAILPAKVVAWILRRESENLRRVKPRFAHQAHLAVYRKSRHIEYVRRIRPKENRDAVIVQRFHDAPLDH
jgi:hypothetical protein